MANPVIGIDVTARLDGLRDELNKVPGLGNAAAKNLVSQLSREIKAAEKASKSAAKQAKETGSALDKMGQSAGSVGGAAKKLKGGLDSVIPGMGDLLGVVDDVGDAFEVAASAGAGFGVSAAALGPVAVAALAVGAAYKYLAAQLAEVEAHNATVITVGDVLLPLYAKQKAAALALAHNTGELSTKEYEHKKAQAETAEKVAALTEQINKQKEAVNEINGPGVLSKFAVTLLALSDSFTGSHINQGMIDWLSNTKSIATETKHLDDALKEGVKTIQTTAEEEAAIVPVIKQHKVAVDELANSIKAETDAELQAFATRAGAYEKDEKDRQRSADLNRELTQKKIDDATALDKERSDQNAAAAQEKRDQLAAEVDAVSAAAAESFGIVAQFADMEVEKRAATIDRLQQELADGEETLTAGQKKALKARIAQQKKGAREAFAVAQAAKLAEAVIFTAASSISAYNAGLSVGGPVGLVLGPVMAGVALAAGAVQIAAIANEKPTFHGGGLMPDEVPITARTGEAILSGQGRRQIGDAAINDANAGRPSADTGGMRVITMYKHKSFDYFVADNLRGNGPLAQRIGKHDRVGHLRRTS